MQRCVCFVVTGYRPSVFRIPHMLPSWSPSACPEALHSPCPLPQQTLPSPVRVCDSAHHRVARADRTLCRRACIGDDVQRLVRVVDENRAVVSQRCANRLRSLCQQRLDVLIRLLRIMRARLAGQLCQLGGVRLNEVRLEWQRAAHGIAVTVDEQRTAGLFDDADDFQVLLPSFLAGYGRTERTDCSDRDRS